MPVPTDTMMHLHMARVAIFHHHTTVMATVIRSMELIVGNHISVPETVHVVDDDPVLSMASAEQHTEHVIRDLLVT